MIKICSVCGDQMNFFPAGISKKTDKPYKEFWGCPRRCRQVIIPLKTPLRNPQLPQNYEYQLSNKVGQDIIVDELQAIRREAKDYFAQLNDQQSFILKRIIELEKAITDNIIGEAGLGE